VLAIFAASNGFHDFLAPKNMEKAGNKNFLQNFLP